MDTKRREDWQARLHECVEVARILPFKYGLHDCCLWAAHCIDAMCDTQYVRQVKERLNYNSKETADAVILSAGGLPRLVSEFLGEPRRDAFAAPGDVVLTRGPDGEALIGVVVGHRIVAPGPSGVLSIPAAKTLLYWKV